MARVVGKRPLSSSTWGQVPLQDHQSTSCMPKSDQLRRQSDFSDIQWAEALEACKDAGLVKSIGVSNFNKRQIELILNMPGLKYKPVCNQVECHIYLNQGKLQEFLKSQDIVLVGYSVLGSSRDEKWIDPNSPVLLEDPVLKEIAEKLGRTTAQVAMRYLLQRGIVVLAKSYTPTRIKQNLQVREGWPLLKIKGASAFKFMSFVVCCFTISRYTFKAEFNMLRFYLPWFLSLPSSTYQL
ncbi:hypothetical protein AB205_0215350 [Aquarana catesbeiana]|uniref:NADP-dependent oxidoreductase domain-containing protein n=1 Tax=Aquarana catesbeiana TaxID=8400 RepID=A0A2G9S084_AQUCT|nr:hypothetical protein AB205_0215350 [Aquarana catesbeiana]